MSGPDRIWAGSPSMCGNAFGDWDTVKGHEGDAEYIRRDPAVIVALPEVQTIVDDAVKAEREACVAECQHIASSYENESNHAGMRDAEHCASAIRKRGEG